MTDAVANLIGSGIGSAVSGLASLFGADAQSRNVKRTNAMNYKIAQETNANQLAIARENNQMQLDAMRENNAFNKQSAIDMFNMEAAYNSPAAEKERLLAAGINPATLYGQGGSVGGSVNSSTPSASSSGISPSMPNFVTPTMQTPPSVLNGMFGNIESISRSLGNIARAGLDTMTKRKISATLQAELDKIVSETENVKIQNEWNSFKMNLDKENLPKRQVKEIERIISGIYKDYAEGGSAHASIALKNAQEKLAGEEFEKIREQRPWLLDNLKKLGELYDEQQRTEQSQQASNYASANASNAQAAFTNEQRSQLVAMRSDIIAINKALRNEKELNNGKLAYTLDSQVETLKNQKLISDENVKMIHELAEKAKKENSSYYWRMAFDMIERSMKAAAALKGFSLGSSGSNDGLYTPIWSTSSSAGY